MKVIRDPKEKKIKVKAKSALVGRISKKIKGKDDDYFPAFIKLFDINNPHKTAEFPHTVYEFRNVEKIRIRRLNVSKYLEGNHLVLNDLEELYIIHEPTKLVLKGYQIEVEHRRETKKKK